MKGRPADLRVLVRVLAGGPVVVDGVLLVLVFVLLAAPQGLTGTGSRLHGSCPPVSS